MAQNLLQAPTTLPVKVEDRIPKAMSQSRAHPTVRICDRKDPYDGRSTVIAAGVLAWAAPEPWV